MKTLFPAIALAFTMLLASCGDDDATPSPTTQPTAAATRTVTAAATASSTLAPSATATKPASTPPADGTIDPLGAGGTERWTVKANPENAAGTILLKDVRMGVHPEQGGWERIVFEFAGTARPAGVIEYVNSVSQCGSGAPVALKGTAIISFRFSGAAAHDSAGQATFAKKELAGPGTTILDVKAACDFEGVVAWAAGLKGKQNFKVTTLENPMRIVVDVKQ